MAHLHPPGGHFDRLRMLALTTATIDTSTAWEDEISTKSLQQWFDLVKPFVTPEAYAAFDTPYRPSFNALKDIPFYPNDHGTYFNLLQTAFGRYIYPGSVPRQLAKERKAAHDSPQALVQHPNSTYYRIKHSTTTPCQSQFVTPFRIPIPPNLNPMEKALRRLLCRVAEAMFAFWMCAFDTGRGSALAAIAAQKSQEMYGTGTFEWDRTLTHSPFKEQLGTADFGTVRKQRFEEHLAVLKELYDDDVPQDVVDKAWKRSRLDNASQNASRDRRRTNMSANQVSVEKGKDKARKSKRKEKETTESKEETARYHVTYHRNMVDNMTEEDLDDFHEKNRLKMRKSRAKKKAQRMGNLSVAGKTATPAIVMNDTVVSRLKKKAPGEGHPNAPGSTAATAIALDDTDVSATATVNTASKIPFVNRTITAPRRRFMPSTSLKGKAYPVISSSESEPESESESESLNGFIVDDDVDD